MKYKLKKDLPFAKAGITISFTEDAIVIDTDIDRANYYFGRDELDDLIKEGWIEEVKPREWCIVEVETPLGDWILWTTRFATQDDAEKYMADRWAGNSRTYKVREVLE